MLQLGVYAAMQIQFFTLEVGDVIMTGTPAGVAALHTGDDLKMTLKGQSQDFVWKTFVK